LPGAIAVAGGREGEAAGGSKGEGKRPCDLFKKDRTNFCDFFAVFSAIFRLGFGSGAGEEGGWTAAIAGDGLPAGSRRHSAAAAAAAARRERGVVIYHKGD